MARGDTIDGPTVRPRRRSRTGRVVRGFFGLALLLPLAWAGGFAWFALTMLDRVADPDTRTDAIVVLTGGSGRVDEGVRLLVDGRADVLFLSGVNRKVEKHELLALAGGVPEDVAERVILGYRAEHTRGNAAETALWANSRSLGSLRLVTANYHMRRSLLELERRLPGVEIVPHPVFPRETTADSWWRNRVGRTVMLREYSKYLLALVHVGTE